MTLSDKKGTPSAPLTIMTYHVLRVISSQSRGASNVFVNAAFHPSLITAAAPVGNTPEELMERMESLLCQK